MFAFSFREAKNKNQNFPIAHLPYKVAGGQNKIQVWRDIGEKNF